MRIKFFEGKKELDPKLMGKVVLGNAKKNLIYALLGGVVFACFYFIFGEDLNSNSQIGFLGLFVSIAAILLMGEKTHQNAFVVIVCFGLFFSMITPVLDTPDETAHLARAMYLASGKFVVSSQDAELTISEDYQLLQQQMKSTIINNDLNVQDSGFQKVESAGLKATNAYSFISYLPQAIGVGFGRLINLSVLWSFYLGRMTNLIFYAFLASLAIKLTPAFKSVFFVVATTPMAIYIAASYNQDAFGMGLILATIAYFLYFLSRKEHSIGIREIVTYTSLCMLIALTKFPFVLLIVLPVFIPMVKFKKLSKVSTYLLTFLGIMIAAVFSIIWMKFYSAIPHPFLPEGVNMEEQLQFLLSDPILNAQMMGRNLLEGLINYLMIFDFGWLSYSSNGLSLLYLFFFGSICVFYPREFIQKPMSRIGALIVVLGIYVAINLSMYLTWTPVGSDTISGVQGRYFIGLLPLIPMILNVGPTFKQLKSHQIKQYITIVTMVPVYFLIMALTFTLRQYY